MTDKVIVFARKAAAEILRNYPKLDHWINECREEIEHPLKEADDNVGGGKSNNITLPQELFIIRVESDPKINFYTRQKKAVDYAINLCDDEKTIELIDKFYWKKHPKKIEGVAYDLGISRSNAFYKLDKIYDSIIRFYLENEIEKTYI